MKKNREDFAFVPTDKTSILDAIEENYGKFRLQSPEQTVERCYEFDNGSFIKVYKDNESQGKTGKIYMHGRNEDYQKFREMDMRRNNNPVEESNAASPHISELNFNNGVIGSDETGNGETFKFLIVTAAYIDGKNEDDIKAFIKMGVDDSKKISDSAIDSIGEEVTGIRKEDIEKILKDGTTLITDHSGRFAIRIITNEEYNQKCYENNENKNDLLKEAHLEVLRAVYKKHPDCKIVVDDFYDKNKQSINSFKSDLGSQEPPIGADNIFMTVKADSKITAVSLASVISSYICNLCYDYVQKDLDNIYKINPNDGLLLPKGNPNTSSLSSFFSTLKPDKRDEFIGKYAKKSFDNVKNAMK